MLSSDRIYAPLAADIVRHEKGATVLDVQPMLGGVVNKVFDVRTPDGSCVVRMSPDSLKIFEKEQWAMARAAERGVLVPEIYALGATDRFDYMLMQKIDGVTGSAFKGDKSGILRELGRSARLINSIAVEGFGFHLDLSGTPRFTQTWQDLVAEGEQIIFGTDALIAMGALDAAQFYRAHAFLQRMRGWDHPPMLTHSDLSLGNMVVTDGGDVYVIDWTQAKGSPAPMFDIGCFAIRDPSLAKPFVEGYGLSEDEYRAIKPDADCVGLASVLGAACWAASQNHPQMPKFLETVRDVYSRIFPPASAPIRNSAPRPF